MSDGYTFGLFGSLSLLYVCACLISKVLLNALISIGTCFEIMAIKAHVHFRALQCRNNVTLHVRYNKKLRKLGHRYVEM